METDQQLIATTFVNSLVSPLPPNIEFFAPDLTHFSQIEMVYKLEIRFSIKQYH